MKQKNETWAAAETALKAKLEAKAKAEQPAADTKTKAPANDAAAKSLEGEIKKLEQRLAAANRPLKTARRSWLLPKPP